MIVRRASYRLELAPDGRRATLTSPAGEHWLTLSLLASFDRADAADETVGRRAGDEVVDAAALALGGDGEAPVLDPGALVDEVGHVLARRPAARRVPALDGLRARGVLGERAAAQDLGEVLALRHRGILTPPATPG
jgi:hypothetical protein